MGRIYQRLRNEILTAPPLVTPPMALAIAPDMGRSPAAYHWEVFETEPGVAVVQLFGRQNYLFPGKSVRPRPTQDSYFRMDVSLLHESMGLRKDIESLVERESRQIALDARREQRAFRTHMRKLQ